MGRPRRIARQCAFALTLTSALASGLGLNPTPAAAATGSISGTVTDADGNPLPGRRVVATAPGEYCRSDVYASEMPPQVPILGEGLTEADGTFLIGGLADGSYWVCFEHPFRAIGGVSWEMYEDEGYAYQLEGYCSLGSGGFASTFRSPEPVDVIDGAERRGIDATLSPTAAVTGRVTDADGAPVPDVWVSARRYSWSWGCMGIPLETAEVVDSATTDADGRYLMDAVTPGATAIVFRAPIDSPLPDMAWPSSPPEPALVCGGNLAGLAAYPTFLTDNSVLVADQVLSTGRIASGQIHGLHRAPLDDAWIRAVRRGVMVSATGPGEGGCPEVWTDTYTDASGRWQFELPNEWYRLSIPRPPGLVVPTNPYTGVIGTDIPPTDPLPPLDIQLQPVCQWFDDRVFTDLGGAHPACPAAEALAREGTVTAYADGTFRPDVAMSRGALVTWLWRMAGSPAVTPPTATWSDVPLTHPMSRAVEWATAGGILRGYGDDTFRPSYSVSRGLLAAALWRSAGSPTTDPDTGLPYPPPTFVDAPHTGTLYRALAWAQAEQIATGYADGTYRPTTTATRRAAAAMAAWTPLP